MPDSCPHCGTNLPPVQDGFCPDCRGDLAEAPLEPRPDRAVPGGDALATGVWYTTKDRLFSWMKMRWFDDQGSISAAPPRFVFRGQRTRFGMSRLVAVRLDGPVVPWGAAVNLALGNVLVLFLAWAGAFNILTLDNPYTYVVLAAIDVLAVAMWPLYWVRVDYLSDNDQPGRAYFTTASLVERWKGGPKRLSALLRRNAGLAE